MVDITPLIARGSQIVDKYGNGGFVITGERYSSDLILFPDRTLILDDIREEVSELNISVIIERAEEVDILLYGGGESARFFSDELEKVLRKNKITVEVMNTGAACRTWNALLSEGRQIAAVLHTV